MAYREGKDGEMLKDRSLMNCEEKGEKKRMRERKRRRKREIDRQIIKKKDI